MLISPKACLPCCSNGLRIGPLETEQKKKRFVFANLKWPKQAKCCRAQGRHPDYLASAVKTKVEVGKVAASLPRAGSRVLIQPPPAGHEAMGS